MRGLRLLAAFLAAAATTFVLATVFYTQQVIAKSADVGAEYTSAQMLGTLKLNFVGLAPAYGAVLGVALLIGFLVATALKRVLRPLSPIAYPLAGAAAVWTAITLIENTMAAGGAGAIGGARDALGLGLQCIAGATGGIVFAALAGRGRN